MVKIARIKLIKIFIPLVLLSIFSPSNVIGDQRKCLIKYGEDLEGSQLDSNEFEVNLNSRKDYEDSFNCFKIGLEHNKDKMPLQGRPIYACCYGYVI
tara:strand:+ start:1246 stop:1536 length:291 start_codon:yes stop_codon:yes gene_type:complete